jgi:Type VI secretion system (T6SS), amidase effector protein 4
MLRFDTLWYRHPANNATQYPCIAPTNLTNLEGKAIAQGFPCFSNQCAIRMGVSLKQAGVTLGELGRQETCRVHGPDEMHIIRAQSLADALLSARIDGLGKPEKITGTDARQFYAKLYGRTGIIFIKDYWARSGETQANATGDHIDVWNGYRSSTKWLMEWFSWLGYTSNYAEAKEVWFWEVK